jgi:hypothetical protein
MIIFKIRGVVRERETGHPLPGLVVKAYDKDLRFDDVLGSAVSGELGRFEILSELADFRELFETRPDIYFKVFRQSGTLLYAADDAVAWDSSQLSESIVDVPAERLHEADPPRLVLSGTNGTRREEFSPGEALTVAMTGLRPSAAYDLKVSADGRELFTSRLLTNRRGEIEPTVLWPQMGFDDPNSQAIYTPAEALARWGGRPVELTVGSDDKVIAAQRFRFGRQFAEPLVLATDHEGRLVNGFEAGAQPVYVTVAGLPFSGRVRIYLVQRQHDWNTGDAFTAVLTREADVTAEPTTVELAASVAPGAYDFIVRPIRYGYEEDDEPRLLAADIVGGRRTTGLVVREGFWTAKPVLRRLREQDRGERAYRQRRAVLPIRRHVRGRRGRLRRARSGIVDPGNLSKMCAFYLIANKTDAQWNADNSLNHLLGGNGAVQKIKVQTGCVNGNKILLWPAANTVGEYDIVADFGNNTPDAATFMPNNQYNTPLDVIDGYFVAGFRVVQDPGTLSDPGLFAGVVVVRSRHCRRAGPAGDGHRGRRDVVLPHARRVLVVSRQVQMRANVFFPPTRTVSPIRRKSVRPNRTIRWRSSSTATGTTTSRTTSCCSTWPATVSSRSASTPVPRRRAGARHARFGPGQQLLRSPGGRPGEVRGEGAEQRRRHGSQPRRRGGREDRAAETINRRWAQHQRGDVARAYGPVWPRDPGRPSMPSRTSSSTGRATGMCRGVQLVHSVAWLRLAHDRFLALRQGFRCAQEHGVRLSGIPQRIHHHEF